MWERDTIRKNFAKLLATFDPHVVLTSLNTAISGDLAYDSGTQDQTITPVKTRGAPIHAKGSNLDPFQRQKSSSRQILEQTWTLLEPLKL
jgi:hypothetical protein